MATFKPQTSDFEKISIDEKTIRVLKKDAYDSFGIHLLNLGNIEKKALPTDSIAAVFDLQGFTKFCVQSDPQFSLPAFLNKFLNWIFKTIKDEMTHAVHDQGIQLWGPLPYYTKFMGDGLLVLWDVSGYPDAALRNVIIKCRNICTKYQNEFFKIISNEVSYVPRLLRCGVARGTVFSVGDGNDFVGPCINLAARLQKTPGATFAFSPRGITFEGKTVSEFFKTKIVTKKMNIRGVGEAELICILANEFAKMSEEEKNLLLNPEA